MTDQTQEPLDIVPFQMLTQKEQWDHLQRFHTKMYYELSKASKTPKAEMEEWHAKVHLAGTNMRHPHTHTAAVPQKGQKSTELAPMDLTKPLGASQRKALKDLVENDFSALRAEINQFADDMARQKREEIQADYAARGADQTDFLARGRKLMNDYRVGCDQLTLEASRAGVELKMPGIYTRDIETKVNGLNTAIKLAEAEVDAERKRALNSLERARLTAQRKVLMSGVNEEALAILDTIPNARDLMVQAAQERANLPQAVTS